MENVDVDRVVIKVVVAIGIPTAIFVVGHQNASARIDAIPREMRAEFFRNTRGAGKVVPGKRIRENLHERGASDVSGRGDRSERS